VREEILWIAIGSIAQICIVLTVPTSILLYYLGERHQRRAKAREEQLLLEQFHQQERDKFYAQLDRTYLDVLKMVIDKPHLAHGERQRTENEKIEYNAFAFIMWNFIESIYDFCDKDPALAETWHCILETEAETHADWFNRSPNRRKFKDRFCNYIDDKGYCGTGGCA
jgi:hypothetical protein